MSAIPPLSLTCKTYFHHYYELTMAVYFKISNYMSAFIARSKNKFKNVTKRILDDKKE